MARLAKFLMIICAGLALGLGPAQAGEHVVLTVEGKIAGGPRDFTISQLEKLGTRKIVTATPWHNGQNVFEGVLLSTLMQEVGARADTAVITALNNYVAEVPLASFLAHPVILAFKLNGRYMKVADKGPLFVIYPFSQYPELQTELNYTYSVWQVRTISIE